MTRVFVSNIAAGAMVVWAMLGGLTPAPTGAAEEGASQEIPYLTGGVGDHEREAIEANAKDYNLKLLFAQQSGAFVANVQVTIQDAAGSAVLEATSDGPLFFAKLPGGSYVIEAAYQGVARQSRVDVGATGQYVLDFRW